MKNIICLGRIGAMNHLIWDKIITTFDRDAFQGRGPLHRSDRSLLFKATAKLEFSQGRWPHNVFERLVEVMAKGDVFKRSWTTHVVDRMVG